MALLRRREMWDPFLDLEAITNRLGRMFDVPRASEDRELLALTDWRPSCDIAETDKEYRVRAELPDVKKEDVHVTFENNTLTIRGERKEEKEDKGLRFHRRECTYGNFMRSFTLPDDAEQNKIDAVFKDGMLTVVIPRTKVKEASKREIAVH